MKPTYYRCQNDECNFFIRQKKKTLELFPNKQKFDECRWLILIALIIGESYAKIRCPHCNYRINVNCDVKEKVDNAQESLLESFRKLKKV